MKHSVESTARRVLLTAIPLTLCACSGVRYPPADTPDADSGTPAAQAPAAIDVAETPNAALEYARRALSRSLAERRYDLILGWLRSEGLEGRSHAELVALAETHASAAKYLRCEQASKTPPGPENRLELVSGCLVRDADAGTLAAAAATPRPGAEPAGRVPAADADANADAERLAAADEPKLASTGTP